MGDSSVFAVAVLAILAVSCAVFEYWIGVCIFLAADFIVVGLSEEK
jgi:hypothetical protein